MKRFLFITCLVTSSHFFAQDLAQAGKMFDRFEYKQASVLYSNAAAKKGLSLEDYKKLAYSYFAIGEFDKSAPLADSLCKINDIEPFFFYMKGMSNMAINNFEVAKASFTAYQSKDNEFKVDHLIASCDQIPTWTSQELESNRLLETNKSKADIAGSKFSDSFIFFQESGKDSTGSEIASGLVDNSELLIARPWIFNQNISSEIKFEDGVSDMAVTSFIFLGGSNEVLFTGSQPIFEDPYQQGAHLFTGKFSQEQMTVTEVHPWQYSGFEDTSFCAHATINESGNQLVFSKIGNGTKGADLYYSELNSLGWSNPIALTELNTELDEMYPMFSGDSILTFASNGRPGYGGMDIYKVKLTNQRFGEISHIKSPINSFNDDFSLSYLSKEVMIYSSNRFGGNGDDDIYLATFKKAKVDTTDYAAIDEFNRFVESWKDERVYFDFAKFDIHKDVADLSGIVNFLNKNSKCSIHIVGHTDSRGNEEYNENLGLMRAEIVKNEFIKRGVNPAQITIESKGKHAPEKICTKGCTEAEHALNRVAVIQLVVVQ